MRVTEMGGMNWTGMSGDEWDIVGRRATSLETGYTMRHRRSGRTQNGRERIGARRTAQVEQARAERARDGMGAGRSVPVE